MMYKLLFFYARFCFRLFYPNICIQGKEKIPRNASVIFVSNHQNSMIDPLAILFSVGYPIYFLARADIFKKRFVAKILRWLKLIPVYRIRDGIDSMSNNEATFQLSAELLLSNRSICLFPEGVHSKYKRLQSLKKGFGRIVMQALTMNKNNKPIYVQPIGIDYSNYHQQGSDLVLNFGEPIDVRRYYSLYQDNAINALSQLRKELSSAIKSLMIHVEPQQDYYFILNYARIKAKSDLQLQSELLKHLSRKEIAWLQFSTIKTIVEELNYMCDKEPAKFEELKKENAMMPSSHELHHSAGDKALWQKAVAVIAFVLNFAPVTVARHYAGTVKDPQFESSLKYGFSLLLFPIWYTLMFLSVTAIFSSPAGIISTSLAIVFMYIRLRFVIPKPLPGQQ